jgi:signal transduction histidine kinase
VQLTAELSLRFDELAASRARLVHAEAAGRRRLERDIHDGVQQELVAVLARLGLARNQLRRDKDLAESTLRDVQADGRRALESLQELVRGIHPPILTDRGLVDAVRERVARLPIAAEVSTEGLLAEVRFSPDVEAAAYFFVSEALGNVLKHARATRAWVRLHTEVDQLSVEVGDDGCGFSVEVANLFGLHGLSDRIEALGGRMEITSSAGRGTKVSAWLPMEQPAYA